MQQLALDPALVVSWMEHDRGVGVRRVWVDLQSVEDDHRGFLYGVAHHRGDRVCVLHRRRTALVQPVALDSAVRLAPAPGRWIRRQEGNRTSLRRVIAQEKGAFTIATIGMAALYAIATDILVIGKPFQLGVHLDGKSAFSLLTLSVLTGALLAVQSHAL